MSTSAPSRRIFAAYGPTPLNDVAVPPFPAFEADEDDETAHDGMDLDFERAQANWAPIAPGEPTADVPVRFVDGSIVSRTAGCIVVGGRRRPLIAAAISAAALELDGKTLRRGEGTRVLKVVAVHSNGIDEEHLREAWAVLHDAGIELRAGEAQVIGHDFDGLRRTTRGIAMQAMEEAERDVMLAGIDRPTLVDGLLERRLAAQRHDVPVVGLVKRQIASYLPAALQEIAYSLRPGERTPAFVLRTVQHVDLVNTYVRLSAESGASPSYGIVRVTVSREYAEAAHARDLAAYLSGLAAYLYRLRHRDLAYSRAGISIEPIVRVEDHLKAIRPDVEAMIPRLHRLYGPAERN